MFNVLLEPAIVSPVLGEFVRSRQDWDHGARGEAGGEALEWRHGASGRAGAAPAGADAAGARRQGEGVR